MIEDLLPFKNINIKNNCKSTTSTTKILILINFNQYYHDSMGKIEKQDKN